MSEERMGQRATNVILFSHGIFLYWSFLLIHYIYFTTLFISKKMILRVFMVLQSKTGA